MTLLDTDRVQGLRSLGWTYALALIAQGMEEDAATCDGEGWINTTAALSAASANVRDLGESIRRRLHSAEEHDRAAGYE